MDNIFYICCVVFSVDDIMVVVNLILNGQYLLQTKPDENGFRKCGRKPYSKWTISSTLRELSIDLKTTSRKPYSKWTISSTIIEAMKVNIQTTLVVNLILNGQYLLQNK